MDHENTIDRRTMCKTAGAGLGLLLGGLLATDAEANCGSCGPKKHPKLKYHHIGIPTKTKHKDERFLPDAKVYITDPEKDAYQIEWCRFLADSEAPEELRTTTHIAFQVDDVDKVMSKFDKKAVFLEAFVPFEGVKVAFIKHEGLLVEFLQKTK